MKCHAWLKSQPSLPRAQAMQFPDVAGAATPTFLSHAGEHVYGSIPVGKSLFDCDSIELWCPPTDLLRSAIGEYVNLSNRGAVLNGRILKGHVKVAEGPINIFMAIGKQPCYRNR